MGNAILRGQTGGASPTVISQKKLTLLADVTIYSARTSVDFTGLNVGADTELLLVSDIYNPLGVNAVLYLYANANTTNTNYYAQRLYADGTTVGATRTNYATFTDNDAGKYATVFTKIKMTNSGFYTFQSDVKMNNTTTTYLESYNTTSTFTISSITQLTVSSNQSNSIGVGSRFQLYSLNTGGEKTWVTS